MTTLADIKRSIELVQDADAGIPAITQVVISNDGVGLIQLRESQWIKGRFDRNIRLDQAAHMEDSATFVS